MNNLSNTKIVIISGTFPNLKCGVGDYVEKIAEGMISKKVDISILTSLDPLVKKKGYVYPLIKKWSIFDLSRILSFIKKESPAFINLQIPTLRYKPILSAISLLPLLSKIFFRFTPFITTVHDYSISNRFLKIFFLPLFLFSDAIIVTNQEDEYGIIKYFPFLKNRINKVYPGPHIEIADIDDERKKDCYKKIYHERGKRFITTLGFVKKDRLIDVIIKAFHKLSGDDGGLRLIVLGGLQSDRDVRYLNHLYDLRASLGLKDKIYFLGFCNSEEASFYLSLSELAILIYERGASFRRSTIVNCVVRKMPVITNINRSYGFDRDLFDSGMVATIEDAAIDKIYEKAKLILYDKNYVERLKRRMENAETIFNWDKNVDELMAIYSRATNK